MILSREEGWKSRPTQVVGMADSNDPDAGAAVGAPAMRPISRDRFDALAMYCRNPKVRLVGQELGWFEEADGVLLAALILDTDAMFSAVILAPDGHQRYRWVDMTHFHTTPHAAIADLSQHFAKLLPDVAKGFEQGDETGPAVDFFAPVGAADQLHPGFTQLATGKGYKAARQLIGHMMRWHEDVDGNFVEQFQTSGFDARLWELYLFAAMTESDLHVQRPDPAPDFLLRGMGGEFALEATTINPTGPGSPVIAPPSPDDAEAVDAYAEHYLPTRFSGPLTNKLAKQYWLQPQVAGMPLVFAIQDFHALMSMTFSGSSLPIYLYGYTHKPERSTDGKLTVVPVSIGEHKWGTKTVPSGFFNLPGSENVSAVIANAAGTLAKFNRMGVKVGFGVEDVVLVREGHAIDPDPNASEPYPFVHVVGEGYPETWMEGMNVYHNRNAVHPLDPELLPGAVHHMPTADGLIESVAGSDWMPISSTTVTVLTGLKQTL